MFIHPTYQSNQNYKSTGFGNIKPEMRMAENVLKTFKKEFPYLKSNTFIESKIRPHKENPNCREIVTSLQQKAMAIKSDIYDKAFYDLGKNEYDSLNHFGLALGELTKSKGKANCAENAILGYKILDELGMKPRIFEIKILRDCETTANHFSTVFNLKKGAQINDPKTWGSKAIVVDTWSGIVMKADEAIRFLSEKIAALRDNEKILKIKFGELIPENHLKIKKKRSL
ncbi:MAG: hypothetical protein WCF95_03805 [bacterium]